MAEISRYVLVNEDDVEDDYEFDSYQEALREAQRRGNVAIVERTYVYDDTSLVWTPDGSETWPPTRNGDMRSPEPADDKVGE